MHLADFLPFVPDPRTYWMPWIRFRTEAGDQAEGPMIRQGTGRRELLVWTDQAAAEEAARAFVVQTRGRFELRSVTRRQVQAACREFAFGGRLVAVILAQETP